MFCQKPRRMSTKEVCKKWFWGLLRKSMGVRKLAAVPELQFKQQSYTAQPTYNVPITPSEMFFIPCFAKNLGG